MELELLSRQLTSVKSSQRPSSHCVLARGDIIGNYEIGDALGRGRFSTVYCARNTQNGNLIAIKIYRVGSSNSEYYENEVRILNKIFEYSVTTQTIPTNLIGYMGTFAHVALYRDLSPRIHPCILFNLGGDSVSRLIKFCRRNYGNGLPLHVVKKIMRDVLSGLSYLHKCNIIHTDIKPSNLLLNGKIESMTADTDLSVSIGDLGSSTPADNIFSYHPGTTQYIAPELIIEQPNYTTAIDIWSAFVTCFEMITGDLLFDVYRECDITYGEDVDDVDEIAHTMDEGNQQDLVSTHYASDTDTSDSSGSEDSEDESEVNYRHLLLIEKVIGPAPREFTRNARSYYNRKDKLKNNPDIEHISISQLLFSNYDMASNDCKEIEDFLLCGLRYLPEERITAESALSHPFLQS